MRQWYLASDHRSKAVQSFPFLQSQEMQVSAVFAALAATAGAVSFTAVLPAVLTNTTALNFPILDCVGSSHGSMALRADYREHLTRVQRDIGFKRIRGHGPSRPTT